MKVINEFYKDSHALDGLSGHCKNCRDKAHRRWLKANEQRVKDQQKDWREQNKEANAKRHRDYVDKNRIHVYARQKQWRENNKDKVADMRRRGEEKYKKKFPERIRATRTLQRAVRLGKIARPSKCSACKKDTIRIDAHHEDYKKPFDVMWLCRECHISLHKEMRVQ